MHLLVPLRRFRVAELAGLALALTLVVSGLTSGPARADAPGKPPTPAPASPAQAGVSGDLASSEGEASSVNVAQARVLFQRGVELTKHGDYANAAKRFQEALDLHRAPAIAYNLASALSELNRKDEAYDLVQTVLHDGTTPDALRTRAERLEESLQRSVARLTVIVSSEQSDVSILVDDALLAPELVSVTRAVAPGEHVVVATRGGVRISERRVRITVGTAALVDLSLVMTPREAAEASAPAAVATVLPTLSPSSEARRDDADAKRRRRYWIIGGASAVAVGVGVALALILVKPTTHTEAPVAGDGMPGVLVWR